MTFWGKIVGFLFGWLMLGPVGAVLGVLIGAVFDRGLKVHLHHIPRSHTPEVQQAFFNATFLVMGHLAKADGRVSIDEIRAAEKIMTRLELNEDLRREAMHLFTAGKNQAYDLEQTLENLWQECHKHRDLLRFFIEIQLEAALADGALQPEEQQMLLLICKKLHISATELEQLMARLWASQAFYQWYEDFGATSEKYHYSQGQGHSQGHSRHRRSAGYDNFAPSKTSLIEDAYGVLGVKSSATVAEIKKAYRVLMNQHHPDKLVSRGLPEGMLKLAKEKTQQIRAAYDLIREDRGFR